MAYRKRKVERSSLETSATTFSIGGNKKRKRSDISRQKDDADVFKVDSEGGQILSTPYNLQTIATVFEKSNILHQCVDAMVTNVALNGFRVVPAHPGVGMIQKEKKLLESFIESANPEESLVSVHGKMIHQYEKYGFGFIEIIRNTSGKPSLIRHCKSANIRLTRKDDTEVEVTTEVVRGGSRSTVKERKRFRRYVQQLGSNKVYFKEFGDPRKMSYKTGKYEGKGVRIPRNEEATELMHRRQFSEDAYGLPRWISQLPSILGSREAEEVNLRYFEDNTVPPMILSVAGGRLTKESFLQLKQMIEGQGVGRERQNQMLLIEAVPEVADIDGKGTVSLKIDKLTDSRQSDGLFKDYDDANMAKVRSSFRLPPVVLGLSQDVTFATANVSAYLAETQVFKPERNQHDEWLNKQLVNHPNGLGLKSVKLESRGPSNTNPDQIVKTLTALNVMGGLTPRSAIDTINETMQYSIPQYPEKGAEGWEEWMDMPISLGQKFVLGRTQQTGEGETSHDGQSVKDQDIKDREKDGETAPEPVEHGQE